MEVAAASTSFEAAVVPPETESPARRKGSGAIALHLELQRAALAILGQGLAPVHRRAVANAKRLGRKRR